MLKSKTKKSAIRSNLWTSAATHIGKKTKQKLRVEQQNKMLDLMFRQEKYQQHQQY